MRDKLLKLRVCIRYGRMNEVRVFWEEIGCGDCVVRKKREELGFRVWSWLWKKRRRMRVSVVVEE